MTTTPHIQQALNDTVQDIRALGDAAKTDFKRFTHEAQEMAQTKVIQPGVQMFKDTTHRLDVEPLGRNIEPGSFTDIGPTMVFRAGNGFSGPELWRTNGQAGDAFGIRDIRPGTIGSNPTRVVRLGDAARFTAETDAGAEIWRTNGTTTGTQLVHDIDPQNQSPPFNLIRVDDTVYFQAHDPLHGYELWQTRGTSASTQMAVETMPGSVSGGGVPLLSVAGRLLFGGVSGSAGYEPWVLDPDTGRARLVQDVETGPRSSNADPIGVLGSTAIFIARHDGVDHLVAHTVAPSTTRARAKASYSSTRAREKRIKVTVSVAGETPRLQGRVTILEGARVVGRATLVGGVAKVRITKKLKPGKHRLRAVYAGSVDAQTSRSAAFTVRVRR